MTTTPLPLLGGPPPERADAARNRAALLEAATRLVAADGVGCTTMQRVADEAGVGKGTVFRRFGTREGLMTALLDHTEAAWQASVMGGPPPLGPGAPPMERLLAFGRSRLEATVLHADLIRAAGVEGTTSSSARSFVVLHVRHLLSALGVAGDLPVLAIALLAPLDLPVLDQQRRVDGVGVERILAGWEDLVRRVVRP